MTRSRLAEAQTAAEVLEARDAAAGAYSVAKAQAEILKKKKAHDDVLAKVYRLQADALEIEAAAKRRLADEYDAAQARGEVATVGKRSQPERLAPAPPSAEEIFGPGGRKQVHEARRIRDAEKAEPGFTRRVLDQELKAGRAPTRERLKQETGGRKVTTRTRRLKPPVLDAKTPEVDAPGAAGGRGSGARVATLGYGASVSSC